MRQLRNLGDDRQVAFCAYCGGTAETHDYIPPRVFLDKPYPSNLPIVPACRECNQKISIDEEYVACLLESVISGSTDASDIKRSKIASILKRKPKLRSRLTEARQVLLDNNAWFRIEATRIRKVVLKLGRGHAAFELNEPLLNEPDSVFFNQLALMNKEQLDYFESVPLLVVYPEVGSRAMQRLVEGDSGWIIAQPERYRYLTSICFTKVIIRFVIRECLACQIAWFTD